jgi:phage terminase Nu1 subunit (DNA packaging protein)
VTVLQNERMKQIEPLVTEKQLREVFPISHSELGRWRKDGCPSRKIGRRRYFRVSAVERWLRAKKAQDEGDWIPEF